MARLGGEPFGHGLSVAFLYDLERLEGRRIVAAGLLEQPLIRLREDHSSADRRRLERALGRRDVPAADARLVRAELRPGELARVLLEDRRWHCLVHETDPLRPP